MSSEDRNKGIGERGVILSMFFLVEYVSTRGCRRERGYCCSGLGPRFLCLRDHGYLSSQGEYLPLGLFSESIIGVFTGCWLVVRRISTTR